MSTTKDRKQLPKYADFTADLIEKLGFQWTLDFEYPVPADLSRRLQIRAEPHVAPKEQVVRYAAAMKQGDRFAPVVVTKDHHIIDGNTRVEAYRRLGQAYMTAFVIDDRFEAASTNVKQRLWTLGAAFNARNGKGIDREELRRAVETIGANPDFTATRIAALLGVTEGVATTFLAERRAKERADRLGIHLNGDLQSGTLRRLGQAAEKLNDGPFQALASLVQDAGLKGNEVAEIIREMYAVKDDHIRTAIVEKEREARREQIAGFRASGRSKPPLSSLLRQRFGFILTHDPAELIERNPNIAQEHLDKTKQAMDVLAIVYETQAAFVAGLGR